jgi:glycosyltransferase involved in cell wall biosynthesis
MHPFISIIIPVYNEEKYISNCLDSIIYSDYPKESIEVLIIDGSSTDKTKELVLEVIKKNTYIRLIENKKRIVPISMNLGITQAKGDYIIRLDAHSYFPENYFTELIKNAVKYKTENIGTVCITDVKNSTIKALAIKSVLSNKFGVGNSYFRIGVNNPIEVDTVPFGCFTRDILMKVGGYDERLVRNQDIEINKRIKKVGGRILLLPEPKCIYYARDNYKSFSLNNFSNGQWNILTAYYTKNLNSLSLRHFIPLLFILSIILPLLISIVDFRIGFISLFIILLYFISIIVVAFNINKKILVTLNLIYTFFLLHFSYGLGSLFGLINIIFIKLNGK